MRRVGNAIEMDVGENATPFELAAATLDLLSDGPDLTIAPTLWAKLKPHEQAEIHRRASARGLVLYNALGGTVHQ